MQKRLVIFLAFFIVFAPIYSNAVLPALAASVGSNGGRVLVGQTIKKVAPSALANARKAAVGICAKYPKLCGGGMGALGLSLTADGWNIEITNNDVTNIDVDIYKLSESPDSCRIIPVYSGVDAKCYYADSQQTIIKYSSSYSSVLSCESSVNVSENPTYIWDTHKSANAAKADTDLKAYISKNSVSLLATLEENEVVSYSSSTDLHQYKPNSDYPFKMDDSVGARFYYKKTCGSNPSNKTYITNNELNQYITNNTTNNDIDIKDIYNFDFSQYNINIGGDTYNGTTINNDLSKSDPSEADKKVSPDLKKKLDDKTISLDDVNDQNCTKNEAGEYDKCGDKTDPTDPTDPEEPTDPEPEPLPIECDANGFYKKVCDWMDWTQEKPSQSPDNSIDIKEVEAENSNKIDMSGECPAPYELNFSVLGYEQNHSISYEPLCGALVLLKPIFVGSGALSGMFILMGYSRASNTGVNG